MTSSAELADPLQDSDDQTVPDWWTKELPEWDSLTPAEQVLARLCFKRGSEMHYIEPFW